jgi:predicted nucleic-acid-binding protein
VHAVDTKVLLRLLARDDRKQLAAAEAFVAQGAWVSHLVLAESIGVLSAVYERTPAQLILALEMMLAHQHLVVQDAETVAAALAHFKRRPALAFQIAWCSRSRDGQGIPRWGPLTRHWQVCR